VTAQVLGAIISAQVVAALVSALVSLLVATLSYRQKARELDLAVNTLQLRVAEMEQRFETVRQEQLAEIVKRRAETYPSLYGIVAEYGRSWEVGGKPRDRQWAQQFLDALLANNARNGVFFSNRVYREYGKLRDLLVDIRARVGENEAATAAQVEAMYSIIMGVPQPDGGRAPGLGSYLKDDLGSYVDSASSALYRPLTVNQSTSGGAV